LSYGLLSIAVVMLADTVGHQNGKEKTRRRRKNGILKEGRTHLPNNWER